MFIGWYWLVLHMVGTAGGPSKKKICDYITITTSEDDVGHLFVVWHVSEFGLDLSIAGIEVAEANFQREKEEFVSGNKLVVLA